MKKVFIYIIGAIAAAGFVSCGDDSEDTWSAYEEWRNENLSWLAEQEALTNDDGTPYYSKVVPNWNSQAYVLIKYFNDRSKTEGNLSPLYTSTVNVKYIGRLYTDEAFDSSYTTTTYGDSIYQTKLSEVITGWAIALEDMRVGDSCEVVIPYDQAYGSSSQGSIPPYSVLKFNMKLVDIAAYELP